MAEQTEKQVNEAEREEEIQVEGAEQLRKLYVFFAQRAHQQPSDAIRLVELWLEYRHMLGHIDHNESSNEKSGMGDSAPH